MEVSVFDRTYENTRARSEELSAGMYNLAMGSVLCWGFLVNWVLVRFVPTASLAAVDSRLFFFGYLGCCLLGSWLVTRSRNALVSFLGYNCIVVPFGLVINLVVSQFNPALVLDVVRMTGLVTATMMCFAALYPRFFQAIAGALTVALLLVIVWELVEVFLFHRQRAVIDWIVAVIFCGYIGVDWARANRIPRTLDNAVGSAAALYLDIINLFLRLLRIFGRRR